MDSIRLLIAESSRILEFAGSVTSEELYGPLCTVAHQGLLKAAGHIERLLQPTEVEPGPAAEVDTATTATADPFGRYREFMGRIQNTVCATFPDKSRKECRAIATELYRKYRDEEGVDDMVFNARADLKEMSGTASAASAVPAQLLRRISIPQSPISTSAEHA